MDGISDHLERVPAGAMRRARWVRASRYYEAGVGLDLFSTPCVMVCYGRIGTQMGGARTYSFPTIELAVAALGRIARRRAARGYLVDGTDVDPAAVPPSTVELRHDPGSH